MTKDIEQVCSERLRIILMEIISVKPPETTQMS